MDFHDLYSKLKEAYNQENLNSITADIIEAYRKKEHTVIRMADEIVNGSQPDGTAKISKCFSRLVMVYHPDKSQAYQKELDRCYECLDMEGLLTLEHILQVQDIDYDAASTVDLDDDIGYAPQYANDYGDATFMGYDEDGAEVHADMYEEIYEDTSYSDQSFFGAIKRQLYGSVNTDLLGMYLEDLREVDMADHEIEDLDGVECCRNATYIDLSRNSLQDVSALQGLKKLEELHLSQNNIRSITGLAGSKRLKTLDLSFNRITDLSPLLRLSFLEYLNIAGNKVDYYQVKQLKDKGVWVVT